MYDRFAKYATMGGQDSWWALRWTEMAVVYLGQLTQLDIGGVKALLRDNDAEKLRKMVEIGVDGMADRNRWARARERHKTTTTTTRGMGGGGKHPWTRLQR